MCGCVWVSACVPIETTSTETTTNLTSFVAFHHTTFTPLAAILGSECWPHSGPRSCPVPGLSKYLMTDQQRCVMVVSHLLPNPPLRAKSYLAIIIDGTTSFCENHKSSTSSYPHSRCRRPPPSISPVILRVTHPFPCFVFSKVPVQDQMLCTCLSMSST